MKHSKTIITTLILFAVAFTPVVAFAQFPDFGTGYLGGTDLPTGDLRDVVINLINVLLGLLATLFLLLVLYGGFLWMVAGGNDDQAAKGRQVIGNAIIGLFVIFVSFAIVTFVFNILSAAV